MALACPVGATVGTGLAVTAGLGFSVTGRLLDGAAGGGIATSVAGICGGMDGADSTVVEVGGR